MTLTRIHPEVELHGAPAKTVAAARVQAMEPGETVRIRMNMDGSVKMRVVQEEAEERC
jgi:hypothetical protein